MIATVQDEYTVLSNGGLVGVTENREEGTKTYHWKQSKPHASYLIMLAAGVYEIAEDHFRQVPIFSYVYPEHLQDAKRVFGETADMMEYFSRMIRYDYPWEKYAQITIADFMWGGMENTSATTLNDRSVVFDKRAELDRSSRGLIAHELAHQWWGDLITCKDWRHLWLSEGFATYFETLYQGHRLGADEFAYRVYRNQRRSIRIDKIAGRKPIVSVDSHLANVYARGAAVLHMLRFVLGDELFWKAIQYYAQQNEFRCVETNDLKGAIEESTGQNLSWFFDQWVYKAGYPELEVSYQWDKSTKILSLSVDQVQPMDSLTGIFRMPVDVEIETATGARTHRVLMSKQHEEFRIPIDSEPTLVLLDKGNWILKEARFPKSREELLHQLQFSGHVIDRMAALEQLRSDFSAESDESLFQVLLRVVQTDPFWVVRREAVNAIGKMDSLEVEEALIEAYEDGNSKVREAAVSNLGRFSSDRVRTLLLKAMDDDSSYSVNTEALKAYAKIDSADFFRVAVERLEAPSYLNIIQNAVLSVLVSQGGDRSIPHLIHYSAYGQPRNTRRVALSGLRRFAKDNTSVQQWIIDLLGDPMMEIRIRAIQILGEIGGDRVVRALEKLKNMENDEQVLTMIERTLARIEGTDSAETE